MFYFKQLCEVMNKKPCFDNGFDEKQFFRFAEEARSIVFHDIDDIVKDKSLFDLSQPLPFKVCAFEFMGKSQILVGNKGNNEIKCFLIKEVGPGKFDMYLSIRRKNEGDTQISFIPFDESVDSASYSYRKRISNILLAMNSQYHGQEDVNDWIRIKNKAGNKQKHWIRKIVHICSKEKQKNLRSEPKRDIDWTHRWEVRGHWRDIAGLGKNRDGEYCIHNKTWVMDHIRGPEDLPVIRKVRYLKADLQPHT